MIGNRYIRQAIISKYCTTFVSINDRLET